MSQTEYLVPWGEISFPDRLRVAAGRWGVTTARGVAVVIMTRREARLRLGSRLERVQALLAEEPTTDARPGEPSHA